MGAPLIGTRDVGLLIAEGGAGMTFIPWGRSWPPSTRFSHRGTER